jgi:hypothetical protein
VVSSCPPRAVRIPTPVTPLLERGLPIFNFPRVWHILVNHKEISFWVSAVNYSDIQTRQDEDIFQITRNINVGFFASVVLKDYVSAILNTVRANSTWNLDLGKEIKQLGKRVERGTGNVVSVEFAVLYHWHATLSTADDKVRIFSRFFFPLCFILPY